MKNFNVEERFLLDSPTELVLPLTARKESVPFFHPSKRLWNFP
jgi:hypothetical protein